MVFLVTSGFHNQKRLEYPISIYLPASPEKEYKAKKLMLTHFWQEESIQKYVNEAKQEFSDVIVVKEGQVIDIPVE